MIERKAAIVVVLALLASSAASSQTAGGEVDGQVRGPAVRLEKEGGAARLIVDQRPFLVLGGELGNSSASSMEYMRPRASGE